MVARRRFGRKRGVPVVHTTCCGAAVAVYYTPLSQGTLLELNLPHRELVEAKVDVLAYEVLGLHQVQVAMAPAGSGVVAV